MERAANVAQARALRQRARAAGRRVGFVPTMGALHEGHLALVDAARAQSDEVWVSVFVNPLQFAPHEDFSRYPRDLERDAGMLVARGAAVLFAPPPEEIYPPGFATSVQVEGVTDDLEGAIRPGHFRGVATVVAKLFHLVEPDVAIFGQKDYQQALVVRRMAADLAFPLEVVVAPTVREADGLAMSSRNAYLSPEDRRSATVIYRALNAGGARLRETGDAGAAEAAMRDELAREPRAEVQYAAARDADTLAPLAGGWREAVLLIAARLGATRLIDNLVVAGR